MRRGIDRQLVLHELLPALVRQAGGDEQVPPIRAAERYRLVQLAQMPSGQHESGDLNALDMDGIARLAAKDIAGQPCQSLGHLRDVVREVGTDTAPHTLGNVDHASRSHGHRAPDNPAMRPIPGRPCDLP